MRIWGQTRRSVHDGARVRPRIRCHIEVRLSPFPAGLPLARAAGKEVSRFSCMQFRSVPGLLDYVGPPSGSRCTAVTACCLPLQAIEVADLSL
ncbi:hypothetical protein SBA3_150008 [Candidatus Sulfopaludibacter sp. SbA3]|nr:hypothetical protein SBA3_150008 [Candidatus Sulfopaludibacter sp. SbA3]